VKADASVVLWPSGLVTVTDCAPAAWAGVVTTSELEVPLVTVAAEPPMATTLPLIPGTKPEPVSVTDVPPADVPEAGLTLASEGSVVDASSVLVPPQAESRSRNAAAAERRRGSEWFTVLS
jgi:hypothetical protein